MALGRKSLTGHISSNPISNPTRSYRERLAWYRARTAGMDAREIAYRVVEGATKQFSRRLTQDWDSIKPIGPLVSLAGIADRVRHCQPALAAALASEAEDVRKGNFHLLGAHWPTPDAMPPPPTFWHVDPDDGEVFPQRDAYCFDVSFRHGVNTREIKRIWELSRLQFLGPLAAHSALEGRREEADLANGIVRSWMHGNHPFRGINWSSGIELALRVISVAISFSIIGVERLDEENRQALLKFFAAHVCWLKRFPSLHSSANNHRIVELAGLIVGTTMVPAVDGKGLLRERSWRDLLTEVDRQIYPDGVGAEQSPAYTAFAIESLLVAAVAYGRQYDLPAVTKERLAAWAEHSLWLMDSGGGVPAIGDWDNGRVIATTQAHEPNYVASIVSAVAHCIGRADLAPPAKEPSLRDLILGSADSSSTLRTGMCSFQTGGYTVFRSAGPDPIVLTFDHGPVGYLSIAAHGHADALSIWLSIGSQPIFVDAGTYRYHSCRALRDAFRHTSVHNTLTLQSRASSRSSGLFNWSTKAKARRIAAKDGLMARVIGEHDGYVARFGVRHRRTVDFDGASRIAITDELLDASDAREVSISFLLDPACKATLNRDGTVLIAVAGRSIARVVGTGPMKAEIIRGDRESNLGWIAPSFGVRVPTDLIRFTGTLVKESTIAIILLS